MLVNGGSTHLRRLRPPGNPAPPAASGDWGIGGWGNDRDRRCQRGDRAAPAAHDPFAVQKPEFVEQAFEAANPTRSSLLVVDNRDERLISPFQNEILVQCRELHQCVHGRRVRAMTASLFANYTLDGIKAVLVLTNSSRTGGALCSVVSSLCQLGFAPLGFSAVHLASDVRCLCRLCGCEGLQLQRGPVPLGVQKIPIGP